MTVRPDPDRLAALHAQAFDAPWDAAAFADLLSQAGVQAIVKDEGFILIRVAADEGEILALAVSPPARCSGLGRGLVAQAAAQAGAAGATRLFLEVADDNVAARALYLASGFEQVGRRPRYYARPDGSRRDALLLSLNLHEPLP
ncbi:MAG: GNAT family N-acetyltransferase [Brevundimonas sp.]|nr:MAG: GNAT family N-acetyltransferase [Brevundimonas sp.]